MNTIYKIEATEKLLQVHYYQFFNKKPFPFSLNSDYDIDINGLNEKYPGFLENFDFTNVDVYDLNKFIRIKTRLTHWYSDPNELSQSDFMHLNLPKYFFCFWEKNIEDLFNIEDLEKFPLLFTDYKSSTFNDLIEVNYYDTVCVFNQNGEYLNISESPNLYDDGYCKLTFLNKEYFVIIDYDDNNGDDMFLFKYINGKIRSHEAIDSLELIKLLYEHKRTWKIENLSFELKNNKSVILNYLKLSMLNFSDVNDLKYYEIVIQAVMKDGLLLQFASATLQNNKLVVFEAVKNNGLALEFASESLKNNKEVVLEVTNKLGAPGFEFASESLKNDKEVVLVAINNYMSLKFASASLQHDKEVVLLAVKKHGINIKFASAALQNDKEVALVAVKNNGLALRYINKLLKKDKEIVLESINKKRYAKAIVFCSKSLLTNEEFISEAYKLNPNIIKYIEPETINEHKRLQELDIDYKTRHKELENDFKSRIIEDEEYDGLPF